MSENNLYSSLFPTIFFFAVSGMSSLRISEARPGSLSPRIEYETNVQRPSGQPTFGVLQSSGRPFRLRYFINKENARGERSSSSSKIVLFLCSIFDQSFIQLSAFSIFMNVGELNVDVEVNHTKMRLTTDEIEKLRLFHTMIFTEVLPMIKVFMIYDKDDLENSFLIVPGTANDKVLFWKSSFSVYIHHLFLLSSSKSQVGNQLGHRDAVSNNRADKTRKTDTRQSRGLRTGIDQTKLQSSKCLHCYSNLRGSISRNKFSNLGFLLLRDLLRKPTRPADRRQNSAAARSQANIHKN